MLSLLLAAGCHGPDPEPPPQVSCDVTWDGFVEPFLTTWCTPCHASTVPVEDRRGAPPGTDFDTWELAHAQADAIAAVAGAPGAPMPPAGGVSDAERAALSDWVTCGALGPASVPEPCASPVEVSADELDCSLGDASVTGTLAVTSDPGDALACVCAVEGDLVVSGGTDVALPQLATVAGDLVVDSPQLTRLALPALLDVGGAVELRDTVALTTVDLDSLVTVGGTLSVRGGRLPTTFGPARLEQVGGLVVEDAAGVEVVDLPRLEEVAGDLVLSGLTDLADITHTGDLEAVGGSLRLVDNPLLGRLLDFTYLQTVGGDLEVSGPALRRFEAFWSLSDVGGDLVLHDVRGVEVLEGLKDLRTVGGSVRFEALDALLAIDDQRALRDVGGDLVISGNDVLADLDALFHLSRVGGDLVVDGNPQLPRAEVQRMLGAWGDGVLQGELLVGP